MISRFLAFTLTSVFVFAGCIAAEEKEEEKSTVPPTAPSGQFDDETGAILGLVRDPEFLGVADAQVGLLKTEFVAKSAQDGSFSFSKVPPGEYTLVAQRLGYNSGETKVTVEAGKETTGVEIEIAPLAIVEPYYTVESYEGLITCSIGASVVISEECGTGVGTPLGPKVGTNPNNNIDWNFNVTSLDGLVSIFIELNWDPNSAAAEELGLHVAHNFVCTPSCEADITYCDVFDNHGPPVQICEVRGEDLGIKDAAKELPWAMTSRAWVGPSEDGQVPNILLEQPFIMYKTQFFNMERPSTYSAVPVA